MLDVVNGMVNLTGDYFSSVLLIVIVLMVITMGLQMPLEVSALFVLPFLIVCYACVPSFAPLAGVTLIYLGIILAKNFLLK